MTKIYADTDGYNQQGIRLTPEGLAESIDFSEKTPWDDYLDWLQYPGTNDWGYAYYAEGDNKEISLTFKNASINGEVSISTPRLEIDLWNLSHPSGKWAHFEEYSGQIRYDFASERYTGSANTIDIARWVRDQLVYSWVAEGGAWDPELLLGASSGSAYHSALTAGSDEIIGSSLADQLNAGSGNDSITGGGGDDYIDGGAGTDRAVYAGAFSGYKFEKDSSGRIIVADLTAGRDGRDTITGIETLIFSDKEVSTSTLFQPEQPSTPGQPSTPDANYKWWIPLGSGGRWVKFSRTKREDYIWGFKGKGNKKKAFVDNNVRNYPDFTPGDKVKVFDYPSSDLQIVNGAFFGAKRMYEDSVIVATGDGRNVLGFFPGFTWSEYQQSGFSFV
jgi:Ca2+-binding RTX toxin-like protein